MASEGRLAEMGIKPVDEIWHESSILTVWQIRVRTRVVALWVPVNALAVHSGWLISSHVVKVRLPSFVEQNKPRTDIAQVE